MNARVLALAGLAVVGLTTALWCWHRERCERDCVAADRDAQELYVRGELKAALVLLDAVDERCACGRFTSGDAPPQYALAEACIRRLRSDGRSHEVEEILAHARGPILKELAEQLRPSGR